MVDLAPFRKHIDQLFAQEVKQKGAAYVRNIRGLLENQLQTLAAEGCLLTDEEFDRRQKAGSLPQDLLV